MTGEYAVPAYEFLAISAAIFKAAPLPLQLLCSLGEKGAIGLAELTRLRLAGQRSSEAAIAASTAR